MDIPQTSTVMTNLFADDTGLIAHNEDYGAAVEDLQKALDAVAKWARKWKIKVNDSKSVIIDFALHPPPSYIPIYLNSKPIPVTVIF